MSDIEDPYDADRPLRLTCACGAHHTSTCSQAGDRALATKDLAHGRAPAKPAEVSPGIDEATIPPLRRVV